MLSESSDSDPDPLLAESWLESLELELDEPDELKIR